MKYFIIAGEVSGDRHGSHLISALRAVDSEASFMGLGGEAMRAAGCELVQDYRNMAFMGLQAVLKNIRKVLKNFSITHTQLLDYQPDILILIDYPSFNLSVASWCKKHLPHTKIVYYIPPKVWAWKRFRIHKICRLCDLVLGIFPFETEFYARYGYRCEYVGNPTMEEVSQWKQAHRSVEKDNSIVLLPGSREHEVERCLGEMLSAARMETRGETLVVVKAPNLSEELYRKWLLPGEVLTSDGYDAISRATLAVVNSGTATLETALLKTPQVAVYDIEYKWFIKLVRPIFLHSRFVTLVNIIAQKEVIAELIADLFTLKNLRRAIEALRQNERREFILREYERIEGILGEESPSRCAAQKIIKLLKK